MIRLKKAFLAMASIGVAGVLAGTAEANVMATAVATETGFTIRDAVTGDILNGAPGGDFAFLTYTSTGGYSGTLPGTPNYNQSSSATPVDLPKVCVGSGCGAWNAAYGAENSFTRLAAPPVGNYSAADQNEGGAPITGLPGLNTPASIANGAYAGLNSQNALSHATSTNNLNSSFVFQLAHAGGLTFDFDASVYLQTYVTVDEQFPAFATASYSADFFLTDLTTGLPVWSFDPDILFAGGVSPIPGVNTISLNAPLPITIQQILQTGNVHFSQNTPFLNNTDLYQLSARLNVNADVQRVVPEPGMLALLAAGLMGLGFSRRRAS